MSSKRAIRRRACKGKVRHASIEAAQAHVGALNRTKGYKPMDAYRCQFCGGYHVGQRRGA